MTRLHSTTILTAMVIALLSTVALTGCGRGGSAVTDLMGPGIDTSAAGSKGGTSTTGTTSGTATGLPAGFDQFAASVNVFTDGSTVVVETTDVPEHNSPYFSSGDFRYEAPHDGMVVNPNRIAEQDYTFRIPAEPTISTATETPLGAIGVALNGVVFFNQYAGRTASGWLPLDNEIATFDRFNGHPAQQGNYHYHLEPVALTEDDQTRLIGFMLDGFPIYGPRDDAGIPTDLDVCNGHSGMVDEYPSGIYHYHATDAEPYLVGCYRGNQGSVTN